MSINQPFTGPEELPAVFPVFPLAGALLLPRGDMPLNIFEPRYMTMVDDALRTHRLLAMIQPDPVDAGSDVFSFGVVLYELLTGRRAFTGDSEFAVTSAVVHEQPAPLSAFRRDVPDPLRHIVDRCLEKVHYGRGDRQKFGRTFPELNQRCFVVESRQLPHDRNVRHQREVRDESSRTHNQEPRPQSPLQAPSGVPRGFPVPAAPTNPPRARRPRPRQFQEPEPPQTRWRRYDFERRTGLP